MRFSPLLAVCLVIGCTPWTETKPVVDANTDAFYVAPNGNDKWSGTLPAANRRKSDGPFTTLTRARDAVRALKHKQGGKLAKPVLVLLRGGTYTLDKAVELSPADSGTAKCPVTYAAYGKEKPVLSGGRVIQGWARGKDGLWSTMVPDVKTGKLTFRQLFVRRKGRGHYERRFRPSRGPFIIGGLTGSPVFKTRMRHRQSQKDFVFQPGDIDPKWANRDDIEVVALHDWSSSRLRIASIDTKKHVVAFTGWPVYRIGHWYEKGRNPYYVENVKEALGKPGEWYLDRPTGTLSYRPMKGERMADLTVVAPRNGQLLRLVGTPAQVTKADDSDPTLVTTPPRYVEHVQFRGITFAHTAWTLPPEGYSSGQGMTNLPAAVHAERARHCRFERCTLGHLGSYALRLWEGCHDNLVNGCRMFDLGGGGVLIGAQNSKAKPPLLPTGNTVSNCVISDGGLVHFSPHGVWVGISQKTTIRHNVIRRFPYSNISSGWCWHDKASSAGNTVIEYNHIHDAMMLLADGGAIYSLGWQPGNVIRGNHIHHVHRSPYAGRAPNNGIFFDQGSKAWDVERNVFHSNAQAHIRYNQCKEQWQTWGVNYYDKTAKTPKASRFPKVAKAIMAKAGLERAYRDLRTPAVPTLQLLTWTLPPPPPPGPISDDFEASPVGGRPGHTTTLREDKGGTIRVTDETAASGKHSLKFTDVPGLSKPFYPYVQYAPGYVAGLATVRLALRVERGTDLSIEWRERPHTGTALQLRVGPDGTLNSGGKTVRLPLGKWSRIEMACRLGKHANGTYELIVTTPDGKMRRFARLPLARKGFLSFPFLVITSGATTRTAFYIDDLDIRYVSLR